MKCLDCGLNINIIYGSFECTKCNILYIFKENKLKSFNYQIILDYICFSSYIDFEKNITECYYGKDYYYNNATATYNYFNTPNIKYFKLNNILYKKDFDKKINMLLTFQ